MNYKLLACSYICSIFNFMTMPLAPPGTKVIAHAYLDKRELWELNSEVGLYVGPAINYYCYLECYF